MPDYPQYPDMLYTLAWASSVAGRGWSASIRLAGMRELPTALDQVQVAGGPPAPVPSANGWELVLAENIAYLVDDQRRWRALAELRRVVGLAPEQILAAPDECRPPAAAVLSPPCGRAGRLA
jgi:hypothetical protein